MRDRDDQIVKPILPRRLEPYLFGFMLSGMMSFIITALATFWALGFSSQATLQWLSSWPVAWAMGFPTVTLLAPMVRRVSTAMTGAHAIEGGSR